MNPGVPLAEDRQVIAPPLQRMSGHLPVLDTGGQATYLKLRDGCAFHAYDGGEEKQEFILSSPDRRQFRVSAAAKAILERLDGTSSLEEIASDLHALSAQQLRDFLEKQYGSLGLFENFDHPVPPTRKAGTPFLLHWDLIPERYVVPVASRLQVLYRPTAVTLGLLLIGLAHFFVYVEHPASRFAAKPGSLWVLLLCLASILFHEFGHAAAVSKFGGSPGKIGFGLYVLLPSFYADVSEVWRFRRKQRMVVDLGGIYFQQLVFAMFAGLAVLTSAPEYFAVCYFIDFMALLNLNPVFHFDGYWFLVDYLAMPDLYRTSLSYIRNSLKKVFVPSHPVEPLRQLRGHRYWVFVVYAALSNAFLFVILWIGYRYVSGMVTQIPVVYPRILQAMVDAVRSYDVIKFVHVSITLFFAVAFPCTALLGIYRYLGSLIRLALAKLRSFRASSEAA
ncbi:MAG TPA: hypothetical protein VJH03_03375 [Blastocatellia bacterium]|nr:hypothetical protein [Blastocatellia bacterium]